MGDDDRDFLFKPFGTKKATVKILLSAKPKGPQTDEELAAKRKELKDMVGTVLSAPDELIPSRPKAIALYDLSTRLRSVPTDSLVAPLGLRTRRYPVHDVQAPDDDNSDEYVDIQMESAATYHGKPDPLHHREIGDPYPGLFDSNAYVTIGDSDWATFEKMLLGSLLTDGDGVRTTDDDTDPTGFSGVCGSGRKVTHCQQLPQGMPFKIGSSSFRWATYPDPDIESPPPPAFKNHEHKDEDDAERWNVLNRASGAAFGIEAIKSKFKDVSGPVTVGGIFSETGLPWHRGEVVETGIGFTTVGMPNVTYLPFTTDEDSEFCKVTALPHFNADAAKYSFSGLDNRFYLRPAMTGYRINWLKEVTTGNGYDFLRLAQWVGKSGFRYATESTCPISRSSFFVSDPGGIFQSYKYTKLTLNPSREINPLTVDPSYVMGYNTIAAKAGSLVAIVAQGDKRFFVWAKQDWYSVPLGYGDVIGADINHVCPDA